jgi:APA family basic amino acid/polyamine antiporter
VRTDPAASHDSATATDPRPTIGYPGAVALVVANMVGTGVFTTLGLQAASVASPLALLALWTLGGLVALAGALAYGELAAALPGSGGEYTYLRRIYHPALGLAAALVSVTVGFAAPVALAAMALGYYAEPFTGLRPALTASVAVALVTAAHALDTRFGQGFHLAATGLKLVLVAVFCVAGLMVAPAQVPDLGDLPGALQAAAGPGFAVSLIYVSYAYSGWNAAVYVAGEVREPWRVLPRSLILGTLLVTAMYLALNYVFLRTVPPAELAGAVDVAALSARWIFGPQGGALVSAMIALLLLSTVSAMVWAGPRVVQAAAADLPALAWLARRTRRGAPLRAVLAQSGLTLGFITTDTFEGVLTYAGFTLGLTASLAVLGVLVLRRNAPALPRPYRAWGYPVTPLLFLAVTVSSLAYAALDRPLVAVTALATLAASLALAARRAALSPGPGPR